MKHSRVASLLLAFLLSQLVIPADGYAASVPPAIIVSQVPPLGSSIPLQGRVINVPPATVRLAVAIRVGGGYFSKPTAAAPLTTLGPDGSFSVNVVTGGNDAQADLILAWVFPASYTPPALNGQSSVPAEYDQYKLWEDGISRIAGQRWLRFAGFDWWVKASRDAKIEPGPNYFTDSTDRLFVDPAGQLHMTVDQTNGHWEAIEIVSLTSFGYGTYTVDIDSSIELGSRPAILGIFTWSDDPAFTHREIDLEFSRWFNPDLNAQFVVQPASDTNLHRYVFAPTPNAPSTHQFTWRPDAVLFEAHDSTGAVVQTWSFTDAAAIPQPGNENVRINLWLIGGITPENGQPFSAIISNFRFTPLSSTSQTVMIPWVSVSGHG